MIQNLRVLLIEDSEDDADLILLELRRAKFHCHTRRVEDENSLLEALSEPWDVILCDYMMPRFDAPRALSLLQKTAPDIPVIVVSGTVGEEFAVEIMRAGAQDYLMKDRLSRLGEVVQRTLSEAATRHEKNLAEERLQLALKAAKMGTWDWIITEDKFSVDTPHDIFFEEQGSSFSSSLNGYLQQIHPEDRKHVELAFQNAVISRKEDLFVEHRVPHGPTKSRWLEVRGQLFLNKRGHPHRMAGTITDTTLRHSLEEQLLHSQKTEAMGRLAGGIAHDFNNLLTVVLSCSQMAEMIVRDQEVVQDLISPVREAAERASALTRQLLVFARREVTSPRPLSITRTVKHTTRMLRRIVGEDIGLHLDMQKDLWPVWMDSSQCEQILVNLTVNARDAMPNGGDLHISTRNLSSHQAPHTLPPGDWVQLDVKDNGHGMTPDVQARIFEPFFTTKEHGRGTGLGLATCHSVVKRSNGHIFVESTLDQGTSFYVYLPRCTTCAPEDLQPKPSSTLPSGTETILLVEDDDMVRVVAERVLTRRGYKVLSAANAEEAMNLSQTHAETINLLLTDVVMPKTSGVTLASMLKEQRPEIAILYTSGYTGDVILQHGYTHNQVDLLQKPYTVVQLTQRVRETLSTNTL